MTGTSAVDASFFQSVEVIRENVHSRSAIGFDYVEQSVNQNQIEGRITGKLPPWLRRASGLGEFQRRSFSLTLR